MGNAAEVSGNPKCIEVRDNLNGAGLRRFRLEGGALRDDWAAAVEKRAEPAWCEITVWFDNDQLGSYGGTVWPSAWPRLFTTLPDSAQLGSGRMLLTAAGRALLVEASNG